MSFLRFDLAGSLVDGTGLSTADIADLEPELTAARDEVLGEDLELFARPRSIPPEKQPLDAGFLVLPETILAEYRRDRGSSELNQLLDTARRLRGVVDRVVVLGIGGSYMGARALMEACCHPYHNELSRGERGEYPRMYFEGNNVDNDASQALIDLLGRGEPARSVGEPWAIVVISKSGGTLETAIAFRQFLSVLKQTCGAERLGELVVPVTGRSGKLFELSRALQCRDMFFVPDGVGGRFSVFSPVGLLPAAILGLDVVKLLEGAVAMNEHFRSVPYEENIILQFAAATHFMYQQRNYNLRIMSAWAKGLEAVGLWYDQLLAESLGKQQRGSTPLTVVNTRDLHSRAQQHQEGSRDKYIINLIVDTWRRDLLPVGQQDWNHDQLNQIADRTLPEIMTAAIKGTNQAYLDDKRPTANLHLPRPDEFHLGQLLQMLMTATVVEGRLMKINPYGQPGVEKYKQHMNRELDLA